MDIENKWKNEGSYVSLVLLVNYTYQLTLKLSEEIACRKEVIGKLNEIWILKTSG